MTSENTITSTGCWGVNVRNKVEVEADLRLKLKSNRDCHPAFPLALHNISEII